MAIRVLVVDDSSFMRHRLTEILGADREIQVVGCAGNGLEAVRRTTELRPDVITMDVEMPVMDGITAVRKIMQERPTPILMFSVSTQAGAKATLEALEAGAMDFMPKQLHEISGDKETAKILLRRRVRELAEQAVRRPRPAATLSRERAPAPSLSRFRELRLVVIAASTGGPVAIQQVLTRLPETLPVPILLVQHMPGNFTGSFADRLNQLCRIRVKEAVHGDELRPGLALLAPGGYQMEVEEQGRRRVVALREGAAGEFFRPSADVTFASVARCLPGRALAIVLTGMGSDGKLGAAKLKTGGALIWAQSEQSCVVYGMPKAIVEGNLADGVYEPDEMAEALLRL